MAQLNKIGKRATRIYRNDLYTYIIYHKTEVVRFVDEWIILNSGG